MISCIIPVSKKDKDSKNLKDLIASIKAQAFPQDQIEILVITEGDSEQAKAIGIRRAKGEICAMFCADNEIMETTLFKFVNYLLMWSTDIQDAVYSCAYYYKKDDNSLNRYFSLIGGNDPVCYYLGKNDREPHVPSLKIKSSYQPAYGCNGFFYRTEDIRKTNLDNYYPMDNAKELIESGKDKFMALWGTAIWHKTSEKLIPFLKKRYKYARDLYCDRSDRRWKILDTKEDYLRLLLFVIRTITIIDPVILSFRGFIKIRDWAWFWHWPTCVGFLLTYSILTVRTFLFRLSSRRWDALNPLKPA